MLLKIYSNNFLVNFNYDDWFILVTLALMKKNNDFFSKAVILKQNVLMLYDYLIILEASIPFLLTVSGLL